MSFLDSSSSLRKGSLQVEIYSLGTPPGNMESPVKKNKEGN